MREIELQIANGEFVAFVDIPPYPNMGLPPIVVWGDRVFAKHETVDAAHGHPVYREIWMVVSFTASPGRSTTAPGKRPDPAA